MRKPRRGKPGGGFECIGANKVEHLPNGLTIMHLQDWRSTILWTSDYTAEVMNRRWCVDRDGYVASSWPLPAVRLHRFIFGLQKGIRTDHKDHNKLNNCRDNIRPATPTQNGANMVKPPHNTSGFKGVSWDKRRMRWRAYIKKDQHQRHLGHFPEVEDAAMAYDKAAIELFGEFAKLNYTFE